MHQSTLALTTAPQHHIIDISTHISLESTQDSMQDFRLESTLNTALDSTAIATPSSVDIALAHLDKLSSKSLLESYSALLLEWNATHNLSGATTQAAMDRLILDSLLPLYFLAPFSRCFDIGSGAGIPALPLAIVCSDCEFILSEPRKKRAAFLRFVAQKLGLNNVRIENKRAQECVLESKADLITSRATLPNDELFSLTRHIAHKDCLYLLYKGEQSYHIGLDSTSIARFYRYNSRIYVIARVRQ